MDLSISLPVINEKPAATAISSSGLSAAMSRSNVSVARFYDWTDDKERCFSVSRLYMEIANVSGVSSKKCAKIKVQLNSTKESTTNVFKRLCQMKNTKTFFRDRKTLTRGEREIIEGIHRNKRDISTREPIRELHIKYDVDDLCTKNNHCDRSVPCQTLLQGERLDGKSIIAHEHICINKQFEHSSGSTQIENHSLPSPQNNSHCTHLTNDSNDKYSYSRPANLMRIRRKIEHQATDIVTRKPTKVHNKGDFWEETINQQKEKSQWDLQKCERIPMLTKSMKTHKQVIRDSPMLITLATNDTGFLSIQSARTVTLQGSSVQNAKRRLALEASRSARDNKCNTTKLTDISVLCSDKSVTDNERVENKDLTDQGNKKVQVRIYLPSVEQENIGVDDDSSTVTSSDRLYVTRERPLSHTEYRHRYNMKPDLNKVLL